jgi:hypothetical protein
MIEAIDNYEGDDPLHPWLQYVNLRSAMIILNFLYRVLLSCTFRFYQSLISHAD